MTREVESTDVLIIGAGAAGLRAAIELNAHGVDCLVLGKRRHGDAHSVLAAGGINASLGSRDPDDHWSLHAADTLREGHFVCDPRAVALLARHAPERIRELRAWGCPFDLTEDGRIDQRYFGAQSFRRTCFVGDRTGKAIVETLVRKARDAGVSHRENVYITQILKRRGRVVGAAGLDLSTARKLEFRARAVLLAAGGLTALYDRSTSRPGENTGDAMALALAAGARLKDMEFVQFHPTGMVSPEEWKGRLVTEAVRGEGGRLKNAQGDRFMQRYSPERLELDARDVVARAIYQEIREGRGTDRGAVFLDISHEDPEYVRQRLPRMVERFEGMGIDITREPVEVAPTAHYAMGGVAVDFDTGETGVPGLYAVGEATAGVHGGNRLGGNSLAETVVFGAITGAHLTRVTESMGDDDPDHDELRRHFDELDVLAACSGSHRPQELIQELGQMLWNQAGILRHAEGLHEGLDRLESITKRAADLRVEAGIGGADFEAACNLRFMLPVAEAILRSAILRAESRGAHFRTDAPEANDGWRKNITVLQTADRSLHLATMPVGDPSPEIQAALDREAEIGYHHLE